MVFFSTDVIYRCRWLFFNSLMSVRRSSLWVASVVSELSEVVEVVCCLNRLGLIGLMTFEIDMFCDSSRN